MDMGFLDMIVLIAALYIAYQWYLLQFKGVIKTGLLLNNNVNVEKCKDKEGYIREAAPMLLILTLAALLEACLGLVNSYVTVLPLYVSLGGVFVFFAALIWFGMRSKQLYEKYWDTTKKSIKR